MKKHFVLIETKLNKEEDVQKGIEKLPSTKEVYQVFGQHDLVVIAETETSKELNDYVANGVRKITGVNHLDILEGTKPIVEEKPRGKDYYAFLDNVIDASEEIKTE